MLLKVTKVDNTGEVTETTVFVYTGFNNYTEIEIFKQKDNLHIDWTVTPTESITLNYIIEHDDKIAKNLEYIETITYYVPGRATDNGTDYEDISNILVITYSEFTTI